MHCLKTDETNYYKKSKHITLCKRGQLSGKSVALSFVWGLVQVPPQQSQEVSAIMARQNQL